MWVHVCGRGWVQNKPHLGTQLRVRHKKKEKGSRESREGVVLKRGLKDVVCRGRGVKDVIGREEGGVVEE